MQNLLELQTQQKRTIFCINLPVWTKIFKYHNYKRKYRNQLYLKERTQVNVVSSIPEFDVIISKRNKLHF